MSMTQDPFPSGGQTPFARVTLVVIPTLDEAQHITPLLEQFLAQLATLPEKRIVVVDGGSTDSTVSQVTALQARHPELRLLHNPARIQSAAVNLAARRLGRDADVLIRCDAHAEYPQDYCQRLLDTLERTGADAVVVPMDSVGNSCWQRAVAWVSNSVVGTGGAAHRGGQRSGFVDHGHHAAFRMDSFRRAGGYDESFTHNEDAELDCRQRALGARLFLDADIRIAYHPRDTIAGLWRQYFRYGAGRSRTMRRHPGSWRLRQGAVPLHLLLTSITLPLGLHQPVLWAWPAFYLGVLAVTSIHMAWRHRSACGLLTGVAASVMHFAWGFGFFHGLLTRRERAWKPGMTHPLWPEGTPQTSS